MNPEMNNQDAPKKVRGRPRLPAGEALRGVTIYIRQDRLDTIDSIGQFETINTGEQISRSDVLRHIIDSWLEDCPIMPQMEEYQRITREYAEKIGHVSLGINKAD